MSEQRSGNGGGGFGAAEDGVRWFRMSAGAPRRRSAHLMKELLLVGVGGAIGSVARYLAGIAIIRAMGTAFPFHTLFINVVGSFIMGVVIAALLKFDPPQAYVTHDVRLFVAVGVLGGFTTFSSFSADVAALWERGGYAQTALYVAASVALSIAAVFLGLFLVRRFAG